MLKLTFTENTEPLENRQKCLEYLKGSKVAVGLTSSASKRSRTLLAIHEHGSPAMHIPARPAVKPALALESVRKEMAACQAEALKAALAGDMEGTVAGLERTGQAGVEGIRAYIDQHIPPPNAPITLHGGWTRNPVSGKPVKVKGKSGTTPLVDTGQLREELGWELR